MKLEDTDLIGDLISLPADLFGSMPWTSVYEKSLAEISSSHKLVEFVQAWAPIWRIPFNKNWTPNSFEQQLTSGKFDPTIALSCILRLRDGSDCPHCYDSDCPGANIFAPRIAIKCLELARDVGINPNQAILAIVREIVEKYTN